MFNDTSGAGGPFNQQTVGPYHDFSHWTHPDRIIYVSGGETGYHFVHEERTSQDPGSDFHHPMHLVLSLDPPPTKEEDPEETGCTSRKSPGQMSHTVGAMLVNLVLVDTPTWYRPPFGPEIDFTFYYNQREASEPPFMGYGNASSHWSHSWIAFIEDNPDEPNADAVRLWPRQTGIRNYTGYDPSTGEYERPQKDLSNLKKTSPDSYERTFPDGGREVYATTSGVVDGVRRVFLSEVVDPQGNAATLTYGTVSVVYGEGSVQAPRLISVADAAGGINTLHYDHATDPLLVTGFTDRFGRTATIRYDGAGRLKGITDMLGLESSVTYQGEGTLVDSMTTRYGMTRFDHFEEGRLRRLTITDPEGGVEKYEFRDDEPALADIGEPAPAMFSTKLMRYGNTFIWNSDAMAEGYGNDIDKATIMHWSRDRERTTGTLAAIRHPGRRWIWYGYKGQDEERYFEGDSRSVTLETQVLDDGDDTVQSRLSDYNAVGNPTSTTDPMGRETTLVYGPDGIELAEVRMTSGGADTLLAAFTYHPDGRRLVHTATDAAGQTTTYTYNANGQILTATNPRQEVTTYRYNADGLLESVDGPLPGTGDSTTFTYDPPTARQLPKTIAGPDGYSIALEYDAFDRVTRVTHPDGTYEETVYDRMHTASMRDRAGRRTEFFTGLNRRLMAVRDPVGNWIQYRYSPAGHLSQLIDANGNMTSWTHDLTGLVLAKAYPDGQGYSLDYDANGRLVEKTDANGSRTHFEYFADNALQRRYHTDSAGQPLAGTPEVSFTYDPDYARMASMTDGVGTTMYAYHPAGSPGAGRLAAVDGPWADDTIAFTYDELGRRASVSIEGTANRTDYARDALGRLASATSNLGTTAYGYNGPTSRLATVDSTVSGLQTALSYLPANQGGQLAGIFHSRAGGEQPVASHSYTHDIAHGRIAEWSRSGTAPDPLELAFGYDALDRLTRADTRNADTGSLLSRQAWRYDPAGNRSGSQRDGSPRTVRNNALNQTTAIQSEGPTRFLVETDEEAAVVVVKDGVEHPARLAGSPTLHEAWVPLETGQNTVTIRATDGSGNTTEEAHTVTLSASPAESLQYDANGNLVLHMKDGVSRTCEWNGLHQLTVIEESGHRSEFTYDGQGRRVGIRELDTSTQPPTVLSDRKYLWVGLAIAEERDATGGTPLKRYHPQGFEVLSGPAAGQYLYLRDHLGSVCGVVDNDATSATRLRIDYDPWGEAAATDPSGSPVDLASPPADLPIPDFLYTGHFHHAASSLNLAPFRAYEPKLGMWLSRDPIEEAGGVNLYGYVANNPVNAIDPLGLFNPSKGLSALGNAANAGRLYAGGALKLAGAAGLTTTGAGAPAGAGAAALGGWNLWSGQSAWNRSLQQWNEALNEDWSDASWKNLLGVLPFGTEFDDPCEPSPWEVLKDKANNFKDKPLEFIQEIGTLGF